MVIKKENTLADIVKFNHFTTQLLESYNLDFCCRGKRTLEEACTEAGLDSAEILRELSDIKETDTQNPDFDKWEPDFFTDYIINIHHSFIKKNLPLISSHSTIVRKVHGSNHPEVTEIAEIFEDLRNELEAHLLKEEKLLFPYIKHLVEVKNNFSEFETAPFGTVLNPISVMESEHLSAGNVFYKIRELSGNYTPPADACITYITLYEELKNFEADLHSHIHLENNILHPKAIELENYLRTKLL